MRTLLPLLPPLAAGAFLTLAYPAIPAEPSEGVEEKPGIQAPAPATPPARKPAAKDPRVIEAPLHGASSGASAPPSDAAADESDADRAKRVLDKFKERPGYLEDPPQPQA